MHKVLLVFASVLFACGISFGAGATATTNMADAVQKLMRSEAAFAEKVQAYKAQKVTSLFSTNLHDPRCDEQDDTDHDSYRCVLNCTWRSNIDGSCNTYGPDHCGVNAVCVENCTWRSNIDGSCNTYGPDICY